MGKVLGVLVLLHFPLPPSVGQTNNLSSLFSPFSYFLSASPVVRETEGSRVSIFEALPCNLRLRWVSLSLSEIAVGDEGKSHLNDDNLVWNFTQTVFLGSNLMGRFFPDFFAIAISRFV